MQASVKTKKTAVLRCSRFLKNLHVSSFLKKNKEETPAQVLSFEFCKIFKNAVLIKHVLNYKY